MVVWSSHLIIPHHLAIIMDGNGRWAQKRNRPRTYGHIKGSQVAKKIITECAKRKLSYLTLYAFSLENWKRPETEVHFLMSLLSRYIHRERTTLIKNNIRFNCIGQLNNLPRRIQNDIIESIEMTSKNTGMVLTFALSYGGRQEIVDAVQKIAYQIQNGEIAPSSIDEFTITNCLNSYPMPDPDLIIRTSGEYRISNFLLWQSAYSEYYFSNVLWPEFKINDLDLAFQSYNKRDRRFGNVTQ